MYFRWAPVIEYNYEAPSAFVTHDLLILLIAIEEQFAFSRFVARFIKAIQTCQTNSWLRFIAWHLPIVLISEQLLFWLTRQRTFICNNLSIPSNYCLIN